MPQLGLFLFVLLAPALDGASPPGTDIRRVESLAPDPCAVAERIAAQPPCLRAEDCGALRSWKRLFGTPRVEPLEPQLAVQASRSDVPASYLCLARAAAARAELPEPR